MPFIGLLLFAAGTILTPPHLIAEAPRAGHTQSYQIESSILGETRRVFIHLPPSFDKSAPSRRYPVTIVFDGEWLMKPVVTVSNVLIEEGQIPESVIVAVHNTSGETRLRDLTPPGVSVSGSSLHEGGDRFLHFIERELLPALDSQFRTGAPRTLVGTSSGGFLATYAASTRDTFRFILALDTPAQLEDGWLAKKFQQRAASRNAMPLHFAAIDALYGWKDEAWRQVTSNAPSTWNLYREHVPHESHTSMQFIGAYIGLRELFRDYSMLAAPDWPTTSILPSYDKLTPSYGAAMTPPAPLLTRVIEDLLIEGRGLEAHAALNRLTEDYGEPAGAAALQAQIAGVLRRPPPTETVESLLATPFPTAEEIRSYLGDWDGESWINAESKSKASLHLAVEGNKVAGSWISWPEPETKLETPLQYLQVTKSGLTFGFMNGMRPRGMLLHEARLVNGTLTGEMRFGGVSFVPPPGLEMPAFRFVLRKRVKP